MPIDPDTLTLSGIFVAGLATSLHCAGMCGLLTCGLGIAGQGPALASVGIYHISRLLSYGAAGALFGFIGGALGLENPIAGVPWLPLLLVVFLIAIVLGLDKKIGAIPGLGRLSMKIRVSALRFPIQARAGIVGLATPLLPCGPLYAILALALASGSAVRGVEIMLAFGLGAIPGIWAIQIGSSWMNRRLGAKGFQVAKRTLAGVAALSLAWHFTMLSPSIATDQKTGTTCRCDIQMP